jgi:DNA-directed RNA polymerase subunit M/transcription elongation factor TFIIS
MKCPNCGQMMKPSASTLQVQEYMCGHCGMKKKVPHEAIEGTVKKVSAPVHKLERLVSSPKAKHTTSTSKVKKRMEKAKRVSEMRQIYKDLTSRINDLEIQMGRKVEELQTIAVRLGQMLESDND